MSRLILTILFLITSSTLVAQEQIDEENLIGFACYYGGEPTKPVEKLSRVLAYNNFRAISNMLSSDYPAEKYLAVITLEKLDSLNIYKINPSEVEIIKNIKRSYEKVSYCSGCTYFVTRMLYELFDPQFKQEVTIWLNRQLKRSKATEPSQTLLDYDNVFKVSLNFSLD